MYAFALVAPLLLIALPATLAAQDEPESQEEQQPKFLQFEVTPFIGYRSSISFPVSPYVTGTNPSVVIDASPSYGIAFGIRPRDQDLVELRWIRQDSSVETRDISPAPPRQRVVLNQFHMDCSHEPYIDQWPAWAKPYLLASVGFTHGASTTNISYTRFSFGIGGGMRFFMSRHYGLKIQAEWVPILASPTVNFVCGAGCTIHVGGSASSQGEVFVGPVMRF
jgi:hypothetical protein